MGWGWKNEKKTDFPKADEAAIDPDCLSEKKKLKGEKGTRKRKGKEKSRKNKER